MIAGRGPSPALVGLLIQRLPDTSLTAALASGGRDHFGWGGDRHILAHVVDAINQNTRASGNWGKGKKPPKIKPFWRPAAKKKSEDKPRTVADLYRMFTGGR